jgi:hypothetical protein
VTKKQEIKGMLDIQRETMNERYLGLPVHVGRSKTEVFAYLKDRVWNRIQGWKEFFLSWAAGTGDQRRMPVHDRLGPRDVGNGRMEDESPDLHLGSGPALHCAREHPGVRLHMSTQAANSHASVTNLPASVQGSDLKKAPLKPLEGCLMSSALMKARFKLICTAQDLKTILQLPRQLLNVLSETSLSQGPASSTGLVDLSLGRATDEEGKDQVGFCHKPGKDSKEIEKSVQGNVGRDDGQVKGRTCRMTNSGSGCHYRAHPSLPLTSCKCRPSPPPVGDLKVYTRRRPHLSKQPDCHPLDLAPFSPTKFRKVDTAI